MTDNNALWDLNAQTFNALHGGALNAHRASVGLPPVDDVHGFIFTDRPWQASDPVLGPWRATPELGVVHTGAWILPDERPLAHGLLAFLDAVTPPVFVGFGSMRGTVRQGGRRRPPRRRGHDNDGRSGPERCR